LGRSIKISTFTKGFNKRFLLLIVGFCLTQAISAQIVGPYTGIDYATAYTNPDMGSPCDMTFINAEIGDADFTNGAAEVPLGWSFSGTWNSGLTYFDGPGDELLLVSLHTYTESWYVSLRLSDGTTTTSLPYNLTLVTSNATGSLAVCGGSVGGFDYERPSQVLDFADYTIPGGVGVIGIVFEPFADGAAAPDPHGVIVLEDTPFDPPCDDLTVTVSATELCVGEELTLDATSVNGGTITWDGDAIDGVAFTPPAGDLTFNATSDSDDDCPYSVEITVHELPVVTASASSVEICLGESVTLTGGGAVSYTWNLGVTNGVAFEPLSLGSTTYTVTGTSAEGCIANANVTVNVVNCETISADFDYDNHVCLGDCVTFTDLSEGSTINSWEWEFEGGTPATSSEQNPRICFNTVGEFNITLTITSIYDQVSSITKTITVHDFPTLDVGMDTIIDVGGSATIYANTSSTGTYDWEPEIDIECPTCPITTVNPADSTTYTVHFVDEFGCSNVGNVTIYVNFVEGVGVPSGFSPNGDGSNDVLYVKGSGLAAVYLVIYNRYGEVVFETYDQNIGWDGTYMEKDENPGVFTWVLQYDFVSGKKGMQKGNTTLIR
jgi:gliding motility-associated-like protein